jgi:hypothetical protein
MGTAAICAGHATRLSSAMASRRFPKPWTVEPMPSGYQLIAANGIILAYVYGQHEAQFAVGGLSSAQKVPLMCVTSDGD